MLNRYLSTKTVVAYLNPFNDPKPPVLANNLLIALNRFTSITAVDTPVCMYNLKNSMINYGSSERSNS